MYLIKNGIEQSPYTLCGPYVWLYMYLCIEQISWPAACRPSPPPPPIGISLRHATIRGIAMPTNKLKQMKDNLIV